MGGPAARPNMDTAGATGVAAERLQPNQRSERMRVYKIVLTAALVAGAPGPASGDTVRVSFGELDRIAAERSPWAGIIDYEYEIAEAGRDRRLAWSNPELAWELERIGDGEAFEREYVLLLEKEFTTPWVASAERNAAELGVGSASRAREAAMNALRSRIRRGYVRLSMLEEEMSILSGFDGVLSEASRIAGARYREGAISGIEMRLIELSSLGVESRIAAIRGERREALAEWKETAGIAREDSVVLDTPIGIHPPGAGAVARLGIDDDIEGIAALESARLEVESLEKSLAAARGGFLPSVSVGGGYKSAGGDADGFVIGISMPLPLLNRNSGAADEAGAELHAARRRYDLLESERLRLIEQTSMTALDRAGTLDLYRGYIEDREAHTGDMVLAYREGWLSFGDLLEGIRVYRDSIEEYFDILEQYHDAVFRLEELAERRIFEPAGAGGKDGR